METTISSIEETRVPASTAEKDEIYTRLQKLIALAAQRQRQSQPKSQSQSHSQPQTGPVAAVAHAPIASPPAVTQAPAPEPVQAPAHEVALPPSALPRLPQSASQPEDPVSAPMAAPIPDPIPDAIPDQEPEPISAIARCVEAHNKARSEALTRSQPSFTADQAGERAFRNAMPPLLGAENIRGFIACVAHGMLIGVIENKDATKLLYAAQVAFSAQSRPEPKHTPKSAAKAT